MNYDEMLMQAIKTIETEIKPGERFESKNLFPGHQWNSLSNGDKRGFGQYFSAAVKDGRLNSVVKCGEGNTHHNQYIKIEKERQ